MTQRQEIASTSVETCFSHKRMLHLSKNMFSKCSDTYFSIKTGQTQRLWCFLGLSLRPQFSYTCFLNFCLLHVDPNTDNRWNWIQLFKSGLRNRPRDVFPVRNVGWLIYHSNRQRRGVFPTNNSKQVMLFKTFVFYSNIDIPKY